MPLPRLAPAEFEAALAQTRAQVVEMLRLCREAFIHMDPKPLERMKALGADVHLREKRLTQHVTLQLREAPLAPGAAGHLKMAPAALERLGDVGKALG